MQIKIKTTNGLTILINDQIHVHIAKGCYRGFRSHYEATKERVEFPGGIKWIITFFCSDHPEIVCEYDSESKWKQMLEELEKAVNHIDGKARRIVSDQDLANLEKIEKLINVYDVTYDTSIDWGSVELLETFHRLKYNLRHFDQYFQLTPQEENYFDVDCECGWWGSSKWLLGGGEIADTGDHDDCYCPVCGRVQ